MNVDLFHYFFIKLANKTRVSCISIHLTVYLKLRIMSYNKLLKDRTIETRFIYKRFNGDRELYNVKKTKQEFYKRCRQNRVSVQELNRQLNLHHQRFPKWFDVKDGTDKYCSQPLLMSKMLVEPERSAYIPISCRGERDLYEILQVLLQIQSSEFERIHVTCTYGNETIDVPHKFVIMDHIDGDQPILEALKHQKRNLSPMTITNVVGGKFDDNHQAILVTSTPVFHTRYLYKDWGRFQLHDALPKREVEMRLCYSINPETISMITVCTKTLKIVISKATPRDKKHITKHSIFGCIEAALLFF